MPQESVLIPEIYDSWYQTSRGSWIGEQEFSALVKLFQPETDQTLLDVGSGSGYFSRRFLQLGLQVTGLEPDPAMNDFAKSKEDRINYIEGDALALPFADESFDYCSAVTSLCFISEPEKAVAEMLRVSRKAVVLGLLNRHSLLYYKKQHSAGYQGARWDSVTEIQQWLDKIAPQPKYKWNARFKSAVWMPSASILARTLEHIIPDSLPYGGFLAVGLIK